MSPQDFENFKQSDAAKEFSPKEIEALRDLVEAQTRSTAQAADTANYWAFVAIIVACLALGLVVGHYIAGISDGIVGGL